MLGPYSVHRPVASYGSRGQQRREVHLLRTGGVHLLADDGLDLGEHAQAERQPGVDAGRRAADVAGAHEQPVARDLGVGRVLAQRAEEERGEAQKHDSEPSCSCRAELREHGHVPELPEVEALAQFLRGRAVDHTVTSVEIGAISALKTFKPPPEALKGGVAVDVQRHGKWLDLMVATPTGEPLHLVWHLSRAGWVRWSEQLSDRPVRPGKSPIALRVRFDDGAGFDLTEAGTRKRLAVHVVEDPADVPQIATLGRRAAVARSSRPSAWPSCSRPATSRSRASCATRAPSPGSGTRTPTRSCWSPG